MRIAQVAPLHESVPPQAYGGTERVVSYLTEALVELGHDVTLFASGDSVTSATLVAGAPRSLRLDERRPDAVVWHTILMGQVLKAAAAFDIIHFHTDVVQLPLVALCETPCVSTAHGRLDLPDLKPLFRCFAHHPMVSISDSQRQPLPWLNWIATVHHGVPAGLYSFHPQPQDYFVFVGRISPEKRPDRAIEIAKACGTPLRIAAKVDAADREYFHSKIEPLLGDPLVTFVGEVGDAAKNDLIGNARALLMPIDWPEPFGLVMVEALACGTPVIAYAHGSVPEIIEDGVTGFVVEHQEQAIAAARNVARIDRRRCRAEFEQRFTSAVMARQYLEIYRQLVAAPVAACH
ncbi:glycosyltransferase family 4 protein [Ramlibacter sp.]|uniref:glycosyltransferase family 4 protein n=1 Tax=Ramlibacter sp. TaxID=1917967 RepID=UPI002C917346|nr:glycosyltransferase family 4 protein [Ramlibacter sp.]HWI80865.1 glycosyltransferase family 4 protein [Ramlibacter sp.]